MSTMHMQLQGGAECQAGTDLWGVGVKGTAAVLVACHQFYMANSALVSKHLGSPDLLLARSHILQFFPGFGVLNVLPL